MNTVDIKYNTILNNLLDVEPGDSAIFTRNNKKDYLDLKDMIDENQYQEIINNESFNISLLDGALLALKKEVELANSLEELSFITKSKNIRRLKFERFLNAKTSFAEIKKNVLNIIQLKIQNSVTIWKQLAVKAQENLEETNIWPMHIGFLFISLRIDDKVIYAPLFFKEVSINFKNGKPFLTSEGDIKTNEKLLFFFDNKQISLHLDADLHANSMNSLISILKNDWENLFTLPENIFDHFTSMGEAEIKNENLVFHPGAIIGLFEPVGGYSRTRMKEIIENKEFDEILKVDFNKNIYQETITKTINNSNYTIFKITPSNLSQDKAIVSALNQDTIIWGPPGTGKSQTIVNLLTNILIYNKSAIVASQKKAALDVIKERMGILQSFCLFSLKSKNINKNQFYEPIIKYLELLENFKEPITPSQRTPIISYKEQRYIELINEVLTIKSIQPILRAYYYLAKYKQNPNYQLDIELLLNLPNDLLYPETSYSHGQILELLKKENKVKWLTFLPKFRKVKQVADNIEALIPKFDGSLQDLINFFNEVLHDSLDKQAIQKLSEIIELTKELKYEQHIWDQKILHKIILERIYNKVAKFNQAESKEYQEFAQHVRIKNLPPQKFMKKFTKLLKIIYPIIIVTPDTDLSHWQKQEIDYAILDESSQIFIEKGLPILYLAKTKILAGDPKQMSPSNWFGRRSTDDSIFGKVESILDYASSLNLTKILLDKNYRSNHSELMSFSSKHFYNSQLDVVDTNENALSQPLEVFEVEGEWKDQKNEVEALKVIEVLKANLDKYNKIIILAFNIQQSDYINSLIINKYPELYDAITQNKIMIRNVENIQGHEADLVITTVSYDKFTRFSSTAICKPNSGKNTLNVAITRAKDKMIIIKTVKAIDIKLTENNSEDLEIFKAWLQFLEKSDLERKQDVYDSLNQEVDEFSDLTLFNLRKHKQKKITNAENAKWFIDFVINCIQNAVSGQSQYEIFENYIIGSLNIDLVIAKNQKPYKAIIFDSFNYLNNESYMAIRDKYRFLKSKKYDVEIISPISWIHQQRELETWFKTENIQEQQNLIIQPSLTYILNKGDLNYFLKNKDEQKTKSPKEVIVDPMVQEKNKDYQQLQNTIEINSNQKSVEVNVELKITKQKTLQDKSVVTKESRHKQELIDEDFDEFKSESQETTNLSEISTNIQDEDFEYFDFSYEDDLLTKEKDHQIELETNDSPIIEDELQKELNAIINNSNYKEKEQKNHDNTCK